MNKVSMYENSVPVFINMLKNLKSILKKGIKFAKTKNIDETVLINSRLAPDMFPLSRQVQIATDIARRGAARLADMKIDTVNDDEKSMSDLVNRIDNTIKFLQSIKPEQMEASGKKIFEIKAGGRELNLTGRKMLFYFSYPNLFFHITTAYNILRHNGVNLGKIDYLGNIKK